MDKTNAIIWRISHRAQDPSSDFIMQSSHISTSWIFASDYNRMVKAGYRYITLSKRSHTGLRFVPHPSKSDLFYLQTIEETPRFITPRLSKVRIVTSIDQAHPWKLSKVHALTPEETDISPEEEELSTVALPSDSETVTSGNFTLDRVNKIGEGTYLIVSSNAGIRQNHFLAPTTFNYLKLRANTPNVWQVTQSTTNSSLFYLEDVFQGRSQSPYAYRNGYFYPGVSSTRRSALSVMPIEGSTTEFALVTDEETPRYLVQKGASSSVRYSSTPTPWKFFAVTENIKNRIGNVQGEIINAVNIALNAPVCDGDCPVVTIGLDTVKYDLNILFPTEKSFTTGKYLLVNNHLGSAKNHYLTYFGLGHQLMTDASSAAVWNVLKGDNGSFVLQNSFIGSPSRADNMVVKRGWFSNVGIANKDGTPLEIVAVPGREGSGGVLIRSVGPSPRYLTSAKWGQRVYMGKSEEYATEWKFVKVSSSSKA
jgi:hypothetical protein